MTSTDLSSEESSEVFSSRRLRHGNGRNLSTKVEKLASKLQDTNKTLKAVDKMLDDYKGVGEKQVATVERLRDDLDRTSEELLAEKMRRSLRESARSLRPSDLDDDYPRDRRRRRPTSPLREYDHPVSDAEYCRRRRRQLRGAVRFHDDMDAVGSRHTIHQSLRDLTSGQLRLEDDVNRVIEGRSFADLDHRRSMNDLRMGQPAQISSVDRRLMNIQDELRTERATLKKRQEEVGKISSELKEALLAQKSTNAPPPSGTAGDSDIRTQLIQSEAQKTQAECELENIRRRLDQAEGGRDALFDQMEELRLHLSQAEQEKQKLHIMLDDQQQDLKERQRRRSADVYEKDQFELEKNHLKDELREMRAQMSKSATIVGEYNDLKRQLEHSEKQRRQLSDHIQVLNKDIEDKEKQSSRMMGQMTELTTRYHEADHHSHSSLSQLEDALKRLRDVTQTAEGYSTQLKDVQSRLTESEKKRDEIKNRAQETVRQWKLKCKKLERESERHQQAAHSAGEQNKSLGKEVENLRNSATSGGHQVEQMRRQLAELLAMRAQMDEQLRIRDVEVNELKSLKMDLERDLRDCKVVIERLEQELRTAGEKTAAFFEERNKLEDQVSSLQSAHLMAQSQLQQLQNELKQAGLEKVDITNQLAELASERCEVKAALSEVKQSESAAREEIEKLNKQLKEERDVNTNRVEAMRAEIEQYKAREQHIVGELSRRYKKERAEYEAEVQALRLEVQEERSLAKIQRKQQEKLKTEVERLHQELVVSQDETAACRRKYHKIKDEILARAQATEDGLGRVKEMELHLLETKERLMHVEKDYQNILYSIGVEVDSVVEVTALDSLDTYKALNPLKAMPNEPQKWFAETKGKLSWLRSELRERYQKEKQLRSSMKEVMETGMTDKNLLFTNDSPKPSLDTFNQVYAPADSHRQTDTYGFKPPPPPPQHHHHHHPLQQSDPERDFQPAGTYGYSTMNTGEFGDTQAMERELAMHHSFLAEHERNDVIDTINNFESQKEREKIHERYSKLQEAMMSLRQELSTQKSEKSESSTPSPSPQPRRILKRSATPPVHDSRSASPDRRIASATPPPLSLTDEEFTSRFMPHTPVSREQIII